MHNIKDLRKNLELYKKKFLERNFVFKKKESTTPILANKLSTTGNWKLKPKAKINFITKDKYSFTLASSCIGKLVFDPIDSKDKKNFIAKGITR